MAAADEATQKIGLGPVEDVNRQVRENRIDDYVTPNRALGMRPVAFEKDLARWTWIDQPESVLNQFGLIQGGFIAVLIDELFSTAIASILEAGEWAVTAETKITYIRALRPGPIDGVGKVIRRTRAIAFLEASISSSGSDDASVLASSTWSISIARK
jgi:uncharacterized protein (TIGR00369 family)